MPAQQPFMPPATGDTRRAPVNLARTPPDPRPDDLGHEGVESNIKRNTTGQGERTDRGD